MHKKPEVLLGYIIFINLLTCASLFFSPKGASYYLSFAIILMGLVAIFIQKKLHRGSFRDMGFRLNRNSIIGFSIGLIFTAIMLVFFYWLPLRLGLVGYKLNDAAPVHDIGVHLWVIVAIIFISGGFILFIWCLFGEELAFRGYILPKLEESFGPLKAVILCAAIFALWHLPAYYSLYSGGSAEKGWFSLGASLLSHGVSVIPICILYLTTRELYGVSIYHAMADVFQYSIVGNPQLGDAAKAALYNMEIFSKITFEALTWTGHLLSIFIMIGLCRLAKRVTVKLKVTGEGIS